MTTQRVQVGIPIEQYQNGDFVGVQCKYCYDPATTVYVEGHGKTHESMAFCDECKPGAQS